MLTPCSLTTISSSRIDQKAFGAPGTIDASIASGSTSTVRSEPRSM